MLDTKFDPATEWDRYQSDVEQELEHYPVCPICGEHIGEDECIEYDGKHFCVDCFLYEHKASTPYEEF